MTQAELLRHLVEVLEALGAEYMIGGSQASMYYGEPRLTRDVDVVVALRLEELPAWEFSAFRGRSWTSTTSRTGPAGSG